MLGHDPPSAAVAVVDGRAGDKHTLLFLHSVALVSRPPSVTCGVGEKEINRRAETHSGFYF